MFTVSDKICTNLFFTPYKLFIIFKIFQRYFLKNSYISSMKLSTDYIYFCHTSSTIH